MVPHAELRTLRVPSGSTKKFVGAARSRPAFTSVRAGVVPAELVTGKVTPAGLATAVAAS